MNLTQTNSVYPKHTLNAFDLGSIQTDQKANVNGKFAPVAVYLYQKSYKTVSAQRVLEM